MRERGMVALLAAVVVLAGAGLASAEKVTVLRSPNAASFDVSFGGTGTLTSPTPKKG